MCLCRATRAGETWIDHRNEGIYAAAHSGFAPHLCLNPWLHVGLLTNQTLHPLHPPFHACMMRHSSCLHSRHTCCLRQMPGVSAIHKTTAGQLTGSLGAVMWAKCCTWAIAEASDRKLPLLALMPASAALFECAGRLAFHLPGLDNSYPLEARSVAGTLYPQTLTLNRRCLFSGHGSHLTFAMKSLVQESAWL